MKLRKWYAVMLCISMLFSSLFTQTFIAAPMDNYAVVIQGRIDSDMLYNGKDTYELAFQLQTNNEAVVSRVMSFALAFDSTKLELIQWENPAVIDNLTVEEVFNPVLPGQFRPYRYYDEIEDYRVNLSTEFARNADDTIRYLLLQPSFQEYEYKFSELTTIVKIRFAFKDGYSAKNLDDQSIRFMNAAELQKFKQNVVLQISDGDNAFIFGKLENGQIVYGDDEFSLHTGFI